MKRGRGYDKGDNGGAEPVKIYSRRQTFCTVCYSHTRREYRGNCSLNISSLQLSRKVPRRI